MRTINVYLTFNGNCEEAFNFYKSVFGGEFEYIGKFKDMPPQSDFPIKDSDKDKIMHISLPISSETILMGSDVSSEQGKVQFGNNFSISINCKSKEDADYCFNELSKDGSIIMPMNNTFWNAYFGMIVDKYGIKWLINQDL